MEQDLLSRLQTAMKYLGTYGGTVDGKWGPQSHAAFVASRSKATKLVICNTESGFSPELFNFCKATAWSAKVSPEFISKVKQMAGKLSMGAGGPDDLMACMAWESGESFSPSITNGAGSGATGLIQFMPATAKGMGTTTGTLAKMTAEEQLDYVYRYFQPYKGRLNNLGDVYMSILWPAGIGKPDSYVLWNEATRPTTYRQNSGLDVNRDKTITREECLIKVNEKLVKGLHPDRLLVA